MNARSWCEKLLHLFPYVYMVCSLALMVGCTSSIRVDDLDASFVNDKVAIHRSIASMGKSFSYHNLWKYEVKLLYEFMDFYEEESGLEIELLDVRIGDDRPILVYFIISGIEDIFIVLKIDAEGRDTYQYAFKSAWDFEGEERMPDPF